jgi:DNA-binding transcriptional MerR regulator
MLAGPHPHSRALRRSQTRYPRAGRGRPLGLQAFKRFPLCYTSVTSVVAATIPNRPVFRSQEVCDLAEIQPYVLRSWEAEFPDLGVAKTADGPRVYRRADVERVLRLKHLLFVDGLTLAGARKRMGEEGLVAPEEEVTDADVAAMLDEQTRQNLRDVRRGLQWILGVLSGDGITPEDRILTTSPRPLVRKAPAKVASKKAPARGKRR